MSNWLQVPFSTCPGGVSSAVAPELLPQSQFAWAMNCAIRGGKPHTRPPFVERLILPSGIHQGSCYFGVQNGMIVVSIQGLLYRVRVGANTASFSCENIPLSFDNSGVLKQVWMQQTIESLVIQDGQSNAILYNGSIARRAASNEVPRGTSMAYGNGRLWVAINQKELVAGDIRTRTPGSELKFTETNYLSGGGSLYFPRGITGLEFIPVTGAADFGTLIVFGRDYCESIRADVTSRDMWPQMAGFVTNVFRDIGCAGDWSIVQVNQDLYWRDSRGDIRSLANAISTNNSPGSTPISREVRRIVGFDSDQLLPWVSAIYFDNRLLMTASPYLNVSGGISFKDLVSLDFSPISTMQLKAAPAYDGTWTGIPGVAQIVTGEFDGINRAFAISSGEDGINRLWEIETDGRDDVIISCGSGAETDFRIKSLIEYPSVNFGLQKERKRLERCDVWLSGVDGELDVTAFWRTDNTQKWTEWDAVETCAKTTDANREFPHTWKNLLPEQRPQIKTFTIPDGVDAVTKYGLQVGFEFQMRLVITGKCQVEKMMIYATPLADPDYADRETLLQECIENDVTGNEIHYVIPACGTVEACGPPAPPGPPCSPDVTFSCRTKTATDITLIGFSENTDQSTPPKKYLSQILSGEVSVCNVPPAGPIPPGYDNFIYSGSYNYDPSDGSQVNNQLVEHFGHVTTTATDCATSGPLIGSSVPDKTNWFNNLTVPLAWNHSSSRISSSYTGTGVAMPFFGTPSGTATASFSQEDTIGNALDRSGVPWSDWISSGSGACVATATVWGDDFTFNATGGQFMIVGDGIVPGFVMTAHVPIYRRATGVDPYVLFETLTFTDSADGTGVATIVGDVPNDAGFETYAGTPIVTATKCA
jgi:hypothetical protein